MNSSSARSRSPAVVDLAASRWCSAASRPRSARARRARALAELEGRAQVGRRGPRGSVSSARPVARSRSSGGLCRPAASGWPSWPSSAEARPKNRPTVQSATSRSRRASAGHHHQVVGAGGEPGREAAQAHARASWPPPCAGPCPRTRRACGSGTAASLPAAERRRHVLGHRRALAQRVLGGGRARRLRRAWPGRAPRRRRRSPRRSRGPATRIVASASMRPPRSSGRPSSRDHRRAASRRRSSTTVRVGHALAGRQRRACRSSTSSSRVPVRISIPRPRSSRVANSARLGRDLRHHPVRAPPPGPARAVEAAARVAVDHVGHVVLQLGDPLQPGVAGADEHEGQVRAALPRVVERLRDLEVEQRAVAQRDRVGERLEAERRARPGPGTGSTRETEPSATISWS